MSFGTVALAGAFLKPDQFKGEKRYPLTLQFCEKCHLAQTGESIAPPAMFENYFYFTGAIKTMREHFQRYAGEIMLRFHPESVLEIGCNDGTLLRVLQKLGVKRLLGVDPAKNVTPDDLPIVNDYFGMAFADSHAARYDLILANNVFAHIEDINGVCAAAEKLLAPKGSLVIEVNRLDSLISELAYDWIYHEHHFYYSLLTLGAMLRRHGLEVYDCTRINTHAGSMRYYISRAGEHEPTRWVIQQMEYELWLGLNMLDAYRIFSLRASDHRDKLRALVRASGRVAGYGACGRTNTMLQYARLGTEDIAYIVDDAPAKHGFYTPGTHIPVVSAERLASDPPDALIVFAWSFMPEIAPKLRSFDGKVFVPLPFISDQNGLKAA